MAGWDEVPESFGFEEDREDSEYRNAISVVIKLVYHGKSVLFTGDTIGRVIGALETAPLEKRFRAAERNMVQWNAVIPLKSDVIIAPHHGGDNGSSKPFIEAVDPDFVIFSSGNKYKYNHPLKTVAERYITQGVAEEKMFRTLKRHSAANGLPTLSVTQGSSSTESWRSADRVGCLLIFPRR